MSGTPNHCHVHVACADGAATRATMIANNGVMVTRVDVEPEVKKGLRGFFIFYFIYLFI